MARFRRRRGGRHGLRIGKYVNLAFKLLGTGIAISPAVRGVKNMLGGNVESGAADVLYDFTGISTGGFDGTQAAKGLGTVLGGVLIVKIGQWFSKRV